MSDLSVVPVGFNIAVNELYSSDQELPEGPISFVSKPMFEFFRLPNSSNTDTETASLSGISLLASRVLYNLFSPIGGYALDTSKGSRIESLLGSTTDRVTTSVILTSTIQEVESDLLNANSSFFIGSNLDEQLKSLKIVNIEYPSEDTLILTIRITSQSDKVASLQVEV